MRRMRSRTTAILVTILLAATSFAGISSVNSSSGGTSYINSSGVASGPILVPDGSAAAPSIAFNSDADGTGTGWYLETANTMTAAANGASKIRVAASYIELYQKLFVTQIDHKDSGTKPTCGSSQRGSTWYDEGAAGVADTFEICMKDAADAYGWKVLATP